MHLKGAKYQNRKVIKIKLINIYFIRPRKEEQFTGTRRASVHPTIPHPGSCGPLHGHNDQTFPHEITFRWKDRSSSFASWSAQEPPEWHLHEVNALALLPQRFSTSVPRKKNRTEQLRQHQSEQL